MLNGSKIILPRILHINIKYMPQTTIKVKSVKHLLHLIQSGHTLFNEVIDGMKVPDNKKNNHI